MDFREYLRYEIIHQKPEFAESAARIIAKQWNHKELEIKRNLNSMTNESKDTLPCHLALVLKIPFVVGDDTKNDLMNDLDLSYDKDEVVGHVKISRADGRSDGACISYSLVVDYKFRGLGFGRILTEKAEERAKSLGLSYMYLSTNDKVNLFFHLLTLLTCIFIIYYHKSLEFFSSLNNFFHTGFFLRASWL